MKYNFCVVYLTKDYYPMLEECIYKFSGANFKDVLVINVDMNSVPENLEEGIKICNRLGIKMVDGLGEKIRSSSELTGLVELDNE